MKNKVLLLLLGVCFHYTGITQYWQQAVDYKIDVTLNTKEKSINGFEKLTYTNNSPDTLLYIYFHLWPNAYKNDKTALSDDLLASGNTRFYFAGKEERGYINRLDFKVDGATAKTEDHPEHIDIVKVLLPKPLPPGGHTIITTPFFVKLPFNFSRSGWDGETFQVSQWYPKPAVYDAAGWHPMPYLNQGEFYSEFGTYDVTITVPKAYIVAATGNLQDENELQWLKNRKTVIADAATKKNTATVSKYKSKTVKGKPATKKTAVTTLPVTENEAATKTLRYLQSGIHDFAFFANKNFIVDVDTCRIASGKVVDVYAYYTANEKALWQKSMAYTKDALRFYSAEVGEYPYQTVSVVQGPESFGGGMEYPTITVISPISTPKELDVVITHEVGHNWFYGILASNERAHPWMDEGFNSFYEKKYTEQKYGKQTQLEAILLQTLVHQRKDQPITTSAENFTVANYGLIAYYKTAQWLQGLEQQLGENKFKEMMQAYYRQWQFKHPQPSDFKNVLAAYMSSADTAFALLQTKGALPHQQPKGFKIISPFVTGSVKNYLFQPTKNALVITPAIGGNKYDGLMIGGLLTNYKFPTNNFQFVAVPLYATGSKKLNGLGQLSYRFFPQNTFSSISFGVNGAHFSKNKNLDSNGTNVFERFYKIAPSVKATFNKSAKATRESCIEGRTYFICEKEFSKYVMKSTDSLWYVDSFQKNNRFIAQLTYGVKDSRALYPYNYSLQLQNGKGFYRFNVNGQYYFNYANGGGANVRLFAAKFGNVGRKNSTHSTAMYQPKLLGVTGEEDYTYSNYFLGRTASYANDASVYNNSGLAAQQIMLRDGAFKLRLDQYEFLQGRSQNWVAAINFNTSLPPKLLPFKLPLKLFLDAGTFAEAWEADAPISRFLYVGGLQLSLFKNVLNVYAPLVYSSEFRDNLKALPEQNTFLKRLTFSIDFSQLTLQNLTANQFSF